MDVDDTECIQQMAANNIRHFDIWLSKDEHRTELKCFVLSHSRVTHVAAPVSNFVVYFGTMAFEKQKQKQNRHPRVGMYAALYFSW